MTDRANRILAQYAQCGKLAEAGRLFLALIEWGRILEFEQALTLDELDDVAPAHQLLERRLVETYSNCVPWSREECAERYELACGRIAARVA
jgi:hypothetical protein